MERGSRLVDALATVPVVAPPPDAVAQGRCLNCDSPSIQGYCAACGQAASDPDPTLREFLHELAAEFFLWDGKLFTTLRLLLTKPGELTREYLMGHRVRYIAPL